MDFLAALINLAAICAVVVGPLVLALSLAFGKQTFIAGLVLTIGGNVLCTGVFNMEPVFYVKWLFGL